ncbi:TfuA-like core domain-containing protein [Stappia sp. BW2]|jgi:hypothetical protein|uniref:TfuA-like protein n=1 Tax=Stappia sp. BW2 TaxID=2592622 RepID=UPI0011DE87C0|nr:TfuA-like protein [Stappia sp. BW2]TYC65779.1 TfuA-like core domain-containing protein [Stappia sp. BW2]
MLKPVVFAGPSIHGLSGDLLGGLDVRPPASRGDILRAAGEGRTVIGLIDGYFNSTPSVWHKEILFALQAGCCIFGAASMGALRAAECSVFGMVGVGSIFEDYRAGKRLSDADVAVTHAPAELGYCPLTLAMVDAESTLSAAVQKGFISESIHDRLRNAATGLHFTRRTWPQVIKDAGLSENEGARFMDKLPEFERSSKRNDAEELLLMLKEITEPENDDGPTNWKLQNTLFLKSLEKDIFGR